MKHASETTTECIVSAEDYELKGIFVRKWKYNMKLDLKDCVWYMFPAQDRARWGPLVIAVMMFNVSEQMSNLSAYKGLNSIKIHA
jgi:hypothetical protein